MHNRKGKLYIDTELMADSPQLVADMLAMLGFVPLRVECLLYRNAYEMIGISESFDECVDGWPCPTYVIETTETVTRDGERTIEGVKAIKQNKTMVIEVSGNVKQD